MSVEQASTVTHLSVTRTTNKKHCFTFCVELFRPRGEKGLGGEGGVEIIVIFES